MECNKVKNACKICFQTVNNKNGLQCQGACKKWAHFKCLNYTPGKIQDLKKGLIKVTCPCPDCDTAYPKESLTNPPYLCSNQKCPVNTFPNKCDSMDCPSNKSSQSPSFQKPCPKPGPKPGPKSAQKSARKQSSAKKKPCKAPCSAEQSSSSSGDISSRENSQLMSTLTDMSNTVGELSNQLKDIIYKLDK